MMIMKMMTIVVNNCWKDGDEGGASCRRGGRVVGWAGYVQVGWERFGRDVGGASEA